MIPRAIIKQTRKIYRDFLWGNGDKKYIPLVAWKDLCPTQKAGGLNIRCCRTKNTVSLGQLI